MHFLKLAVFCSLTLCTGVTPQINYLVQGMKRKNLALVKTAIQQGADLEVRLDEGMTYIMECARDSSLFPIFSALVEAGANIDAQDDYQYSAIHFACGGTGYAPTAKILIEKGCRLDVQVTDTGNTPLHYALIAGHAETARLIIEKIGESPIVNLKNNNGSNVAHIAALYGDVHLFQYLIETTNADYMDVNNSDQDCLAIAVIENNLSIVEYLLRLIVKPDVINTAVLRAARLALATNHLKVLEFIRSYDAYRSMSFHVIGKE